MGEISKKNNLKTQGSTKRLKDKYNEVTLRLGHYCSDGTSSISVTPARPDVCSPKPVSKMLQPKIRM